MAQDSDHNKADHRQGDLRLAEITERDQGVRVMDENVCPLHADHDDEEADAGGDAELEVGRDFVDEILAEFGQCQQDEQQPFAEDRRQGDLVGVVDARVGHRQADAVGKVGIEAHARRERDRVVGVKRHPERGEGSGHGGRRKNTAGAEPRVRQDERVDRQDVDHRQEGGDPGDDFGLDVSAVGFEPE